MRTVTIAIPVTERHIAEGRCHNRWRCPVALAIQDRTNLRACVEPSDVRLWYEYYEGFFEIKLPPRVRRWIQSFDRFESAEPFSFPLTLPVVEVG